MDHAELSKHLRNISAKSSSTFLRTICKMAAQKIGKLAAELEETKALLAAAVADLKRADIDCLKCVHKSPAAPCNSDENEAWCDDCPRECYCKDCFNNSKWEWEGKPKEVNRND